MSLRLLLFAAAILFAGGPAAAETVRVRSGEHADFSRIVLIFDSPVGWEERRTAEGYEIRFDRAGLEIDLSRIYDIMPRSRFEDVQFDPALSVLQVLASCSCAMEVFEAGIGIVAIDMRRVAESDLVAIEESFSGAPATPPEAAPALPSIAESWPRPPGTVPVALGETSVETPDVGSALANAMAAESDPILGFERFREALRAELQEAAALGLVEAEGEIERADDAAALEAVDLAELTEALQARVEGLLDDLEAAQDPGAVPPECMAGGTPSIDFGPVGTPHVALSEARARILDETGRPDPEALRALFRVQIALFLAPEAALVIREWPDPNEMRSALGRALIDLLDGKAAPFLVAQRPCGGGWAFWALLASSEGWTGDDPDIDDAEAYFRSLSPYLQAELQDGLVARMEEIGADERVPGIRRAVALTSFGVGLADAEEAEAAVVSDEAELPAEPLESIATDRERLPGAIGGLLEKGLAEPGSIDRSIIELAQAVAFEFRGTAEAQRLTALVARALLRNGDVSAGYAVHDDLVSGMGPGEAAEALRRDMLVETLALTDDALFLSVIFGRQPWSWLGEADPQAASELGDRMLALGFSGNSLASLGLPPSLEVSGETMPPAGDGAQSEDVESGVGSGPEMAIPVSERPPLPAEAGVVDGETAPDDGRTAADQIEEQLLERRRELQELVSRAGVQTGTEAPGIAEGSALLEASRGSRQLLRDLVGGEGAAIQ